MLFSLIPLPLPAFVLPFRCTHDKILYQVVKQKMSTQTDQVLYVRYESTPFSFKCSKLHSSSLFFSFFSFFCFLFCLLFLFNLFFPFSYFLIRLADIGKLQGKARVSYYNLKYISGFTSCNMQILLSCYDICICCTLKCQNFIKHEANILQMLLISF